MGEVVSHTSATLHEMHLLFVYEYDGSVRVGLSVESDDETV